MAAPRSKNATQRAALTAEVYRRYVSGQTQGAIAADLKLSQVSISYHVRRAREAAQVEIEHRRADRLMELNRVRDEAWTAWEQDRTAQAAVFLNQVQQAIKQERALLGLDCAKSFKAEVTFDELPHDTLDTVMGGSQAL